VQSFATGQDAKEYIIGKIVAEAAREGVPLSVVERKMMYFSETASSIPDMWEVNEAFEKGYETSEYEAKIAGLVRSYWANVRENDPEAAASWAEAVSVLRTEDHYLLVLIDSRLTLQEETESFSWVRFFRLLKIALVIFGIGLVAVFIVMLLMG